DPEVAARAERCLARLEKVPSSALSRAAARILARERPPGTADAVLAFLPEADDDRVTEELTATLAAVAVTDGRPEPRLLGALRDPNPARRAAAAEALIHAGAPEALAAGRALLHDDSAEVRLRTALRLAEAQDKAAVPVLIELLAELPQAKAWRAEDLL